MRTWRSVAWFGLLCACGGSVAQAPAARTPQDGAERTAAAAAEPQPAPSEQAAGAVAPAVEAGAPAADTAGSAPATIDAGEISRTALLAVLSEGVGRFLQRVRAEPHLQGGRFVGWRIVGLGLGQAANAGTGLQVGDTVMRVNGQSIERPEQFKNVWDSLATQSDLVLLVQRAGRQSELRYRIVEPR